MGRRAANDFLSMSDSPLSALDAVLVDLFVASRALKITLNSSATQTALFNISSEYALTIHI